MENLDPSPVLPNSNTAAPVGQQTPQALDSRPASETTPAGLPPSPRDAALGYATRAWPVLPLCWPTADGRCGCGRGHSDKEVGKAPLTDHGAKGATLDPETIREWWRKWPKANVGVSLEPARLLVVDLDSPAAKDEALTRGLPPSPVVATSEGREHRWFANPWPGLASATKKGAHRTIDVKVTGYVVAPPSRHRSGSSYEWLIPPDVEPPLPAPEWVRELLRPQTPAPSASLPDTLPDMDVSALRVHSRIKDLIATGKTDGYPSRSEAGFAVVCALVGRGYTDAEIAGVMDRNPIGSYIAERGPGWLEGEIARARAKSTVASPAEDPSPSMPVLTAHNVPWWREHGVPARDALIERLLPQGGLLLLLGGPKAGKTLLALNLALAVAEGSSFLARPVRQGGVLYLSGEGGPALLLDRLARMAPNPVPALEYLHLWFPEPGQLLPRLNDPQTRAAIAAFCRTHGTILVIVDPLVFFHGGDENSTSDATALALGLLDLAQTTQAALCLVHHTRKPGSSSRGGSPIEGRGSSVLHGAVDTSLVLEPRTGGQAVLTAETRWVAAPDPMLLSLDQDSLRFGVVKELPAGGRKLDPEEVYTLLRERGPMTYEQLQNVTGFSEHPVRGAISALATRVRSTTGPRGVKVFHAVEEDPCPIPF